MLAKLYELHGGICPTGGLSEGTNCGALTPLGRGSDSPQVVKHVALSHWRVPNGQTMVAAD